MFQGAQSPCHAPYRSSVSPARLASWSAAALRATPSARSGTALSRPRRPAQYAPPANVPVDHPQHPATSSIAAVSRCAVSGERGSQTGSADWTSTSSPRHCPASSTVGTVSLVRPAPPIAGQRRGLRPDQRPGQRAGADLAEPERVAVRADQLQHRFAVGPRRSDVDADREVAAQLLAQVPVDAGVQRAGDGDPVAQQHAGRAGAQGRHDGVPLEFRAA